MTEKYDPDSISIGDFLVIVGFILMAVFMIWILYTGMMGNMRLHPERGWFQ